MTSLESRTLLAGNVTAAFTGADLVISGDIRDNAVEVRHDGANVLVRGLKGTTINGSAAAFVAVAGSNALPGSLKFNLKSGNDLVYVDDGVHVLGSLTVASSLGNDATVISDVVVSQVLSIGGTGDYGNDSVGIRNTSANYMGISTGNDHDVVALVSAVATVDMTVSLGSGDDVIFGDVQANNNLIVSTGSGNDFFNLSVKVGGFSVNLEDGNDFLLMSSLDQTNPTGLATINLGRGNDRAAVEYGTISLAAQLYATGSQGNDRFYLDPDATLLKGVLFQEIESMAPYNPTIDPWIQITFAGSLRRLNAFGVLLNSLP